MTKLALVMATLIFLLGVSVAGRAQEHPEHPKSGAEHPKDASKAAATEHATARVYTVEDMGLAIEDYVRTDSALKGGSFLVFDLRTSGVLQLQLTKVHKDKLAKVGEGLYFACSDFQATDGKTYDLDFFMKESPSGLVVSEIAVHKVNGSPRYNWQEKDGVWSKIAAK